MDQGRVVMVTITYGGEETLRLVRIGWPDMNNVLEHEVEKEPLEH
jgi:hypothetical protein